ncbi:hypothetical protein [Azospirillum sp.]|uniref:hypothetical protein n=1 Tax=Azospirillum sp. TaxID=34012 RepID=UPI002D561485|nr:hypothetical protein [Azospirillum sp.]HYF88989.1 hypothetical protein [Azospirillum sp.]
MADPTAHDLAQMARSLAPTAIGVAAGMVARWSREARHSGWKGLVRMVVLDLPTMGAITIAAGAVAQQMNADTLTATGIGTCAGYAGSEILKTLLAWRGGKLTGQG